MTRTASTLGMVALLAACSRTAMMETERTATTSTSTGGGGGAPDCVPVDDGNPCTEELCLDGILHHDPVSPGWPCGEGLVCDGDGHCVGCLAPTDCPGADDECQSRLCEGGVCGAAYAPAGTAVQAQTAGDCRASACDGAGHVVSLADDADLPPPGPDPCVIPVCAGGSPGAAPGPSGVPCDDGDACTLHDACHAGACVGAKVHCTGGAQCAAGACVAPACTGAIGFPRRADPTVPSGSPTGVVVVDVNGDGHLDLVAARDEDKMLSPGGLSLHLGRGDGSFDPAIELLAGQSLQAVAAVDLDGDGHLDLAATRRQGFAGAPGGLVVLLGHGDGTFAAPVEVIANHSLDSVVAADFDGDGLPDLAGAGDGEILLLSGHGDGTFAAPKVSAVPTSPEKITLHAGDLDGDGNPDLVSDAYGVRVHWNLGDGTFVSSGLLAGSYHLNAVALLDLDGDGHLDLASADHTTIHVLRNQGDRTFAAPLDLPLPSSAGPLAAADVDGDGRPDLLAIDNAGSLLVLQNLGGGSFSPATYPGAGTAAAALVTADLNGDGHADVVVANAGEYLSVLLGEGQGAFPAVGNFEAFPWPPDLSYGSFQQIVVADFDGDGAPDVATNDGMAAEESVAVLRNLGDGTLAPPVRYDGIPAVTVTLAAADLDGDGWPDLALAGSVLWNRGDGTFGAPVSLGLAVNPGSGLGVADLDGDGLLDLASAGNGTVRVLRNLGQRTFAPPDLYALGHVYASALAIADLDGDSHPDLAVPWAGPSGQRVSVLRNLGQGNFGAPVDHPAGNAGFGLPHTLPIAAADLDGDGKPDLVVADGDGVGVLRNLGNGAFAAPVHHPTVGPAWSIAAVDLNGDGSPDLAVVAYAYGLAGDWEWPGVVGVLMNRGDGTFAPFAPYGPGVSGVAAADLTRDGHLDLVVGEARRVHVLPAVCLP